jgi:hypothetical protein
MPAAKTDRHFRSIQPQHIILEHRREFPHLHVQLKSFEEKANALVY